MADIKHLIKIDASPDAVYRAIVTRDGLKAWWTADVETDEQEGGVASFGFFQRSTTYSMRIKSLKPGQKVVWNCETGGEWKDTLLDFAITTDGSGSVLQFTHADWRDQTEYFLQCNTTWGELMYRLKAVAEGKNPGPLFTLTGLSI